MDPARFCKSADECVVNKTACIYPASKFEGRHPRAPDGICALSLNQVIGLEGPPPNRFEKSRSYQLRHHCVRCNLVERSLLRAAPVRLILGEESPDYPRILVGHRDASFRCPKPFLFVCNPAISPVGFRRTAVYDGASTMNE